MVMSTREIMTVSGEKTEIQTQKHLTHSIAKESILTETMILTGTLVTHSINAQLYTLESVHFRNPNQGLIGK